jgi:hypothetical protein
MPEKGRVNLKIIGDLSALALLDKPGEKTDVSVVVKGGYGLYSIYWLEI